MEQNVSALRNTSIPCHNIWYRVKYSFQALRNYPNAYFNVHDISPVYPIFYCNCYRLSNVHELMHNKLYFLANAAS